jgi:hypothetical protein
MSAIPSLGGGNPLLLRPDENPAARWAGPQGPAAPSQGNASLRMPPNPLVQGSATPGPQPQVAPAPALPQEPQRSREGLADRVSTRIPTSAKLTYDPHERNDLAINRNAMLPEGFGPGHVAAEHHERARAGVAAAFAKHAQLIRDEYPTINTDGLSDKGVHERFIEHAHDNIVSLWTQVKDAPWRDKAVDWYKGANRMAGDMAMRHGVSKRQAAAVIATQSPQKDWDQNVSLAERILDTHANHQDTPVSQQMRDRMQKYVDARTPQRRAGLDLPLNDGPGGEQFDPIRVGQTYAELKHPMQKAMFIRSRDEIHNPDRGYDIISPTGERTRAKTATGADAKVAWNGLDGIENAVSVLGRDHRPTISESLGAQHKVRNFYNNIVSPDAGAFLPQRKADVTADTHAINGSLLLPMSGTHRKVEQGLGGGGGTAAPSFTGAQGLYGLHADAYRRAAATISRLEGRRYLPREVQSVSWEALRNLFTPDRKGVDANGLPTHPVGRVAYRGALAARHGFMPPEMARAGLYRAAGGIGTPNWARAPAAVQGAVGG